MPSDTLNTEYKRTDNLKLVQTLDRAASLAQARSCTGLQRSKQHAGPRGSECDRDHLAGAWAAYENMQYLRSSVHSMLPEVARLHSTGTSLRHGEGRHGGILYSYSSPEQCRLTHYCQQVK